MNKHVKLLPAPRRHVFYLPRFHRFFPALFFTRTFSLSLKLLFWAVLIGGISINMLSGTITFDNAHLRTLKSLTSTHILGAETESSSQARVDYVTKTNQYAYWQSVVEQHPNYRDGYYALATLAYELRKYNEARFYLTKTKALDPNYSGIQTLNALLPKE